MSQLWSKMVLNNSEYRKFHANRWLLLPSRRNFDWHPGNILFELRCGWCGIEGTGNFSVLKFNSNSIILMAFENTWWKHASKCTWEFSSVRWEFAPIEGVQRPMVTCMRSARTCMTYVPNTRGKRRSEMSSVPIGFSVFIFVYTISVCARKSMWSGIQLAANINPLFIFTQTNKQTLVTDYCEIIARNEEKRQKETSSVEIEHKIFGRKSRTSEAIGIQMCRFNLRKLKLSSIHGG